MAGSGDRSLFETFLQFVDPTEPRLIDKVDFGGIVRTGIRAAVLTVFLVLVGLADASATAFRMLLDAFEAAVTVALSAPTMTLGEIQREALAIAAREITLFGVAALPVGIIVALLSLGTVVVFYQIFWRL